MGRLMGTTPDESLQTASAHCLLAVHLRISRRHASLDGLSAEANLTAEDILRQGRALEGSGDSSRSQSIRIVRDNISLRKTLFIVLHRPGPKFCDQR